MRFAIGRLYDVFANVIGLRTIGIVGYTVVFGLTCLPLSRTFKVGTPTRANPDAA